MTLEDPRSFPCEKDWYMRTDEERIRALEAAVRELAAALDILCDSERSSHSLRGTGVGREMTEHVQRAHELLQESSGSTF